MMTKLMFDTNVYDRVLEADLIGKLIQLKSQPKIEYLITHVQVDEIAAIPDNKMEKRKRLFLDIISLQPKIISTIGAIVGESRVGRATIPSKEDEQLIEEIRKYKRESSPSRDSLIAITALRFADIYVSDDRERNTILKKIVKRERLNTKIMTFDKFRRWLER